MQQATMKARPRTFTSSTVTQRLANEDVNAASGMRGNASRLLALAAHLHPADRAVMRAILELGASPIEFAHAVNARPERVRARIAALVRRLESPLFTMV